MRSRVLALGVLVWLSACTSMAPGIQFGKAHPSSMEADENDPAMAPAEILPITPRLVRQEKQIRDQQVAEDISALVQPGLTPVEAHEQLVQRLSRYLKNPKVTLRVLTYRSKRIYVDGEVKQPGVQAINDLPRPAPRQCRADLLPEPGHSAHLSRLLDMAVEFF